MIIKKKTRVVYPVWIIMAKPKKPGYHYNKPKETKLKKSKNKKAKTPRINEAVDTGEPPYPLSPVVTIHPPPNTTQPSTSATNPPPTSQPSFTDPPPTPSDDLNVPPSAR